MRLPVLRQQIGGQSLHGLFVCDSSWPRALLGHFGAGEAAAALLLLRSISGSGGGPASFERQLERGAAVARGGTTVPRGASGGRPLKAGLAARPATWV